MYVFVSLRRYGGKRKQGKVFVHMSNARLNAIWEEILSTVVAQESLTESACRQWLRPVHIMAFENGILTLGAPSSFHKDFVEKRYLGIVEDAVEAVLKEKAALYIKVVEEEKPAAEQSMISDHPTVSYDTPQGMLEMDAPTAEHSIIVNRISIDEAAGPIDPGDNSTLNPDYTFEKFVTGDSNRFPHAAALAIAEAPGTTYNPFFLYGGVGLGKTHLMQAIGHQALRKNPNLRVLYITSEQFMNEMINSIRDKKTQAFREKYRTVDILMIDDIQFIAGREGTQQEFFWTFEALKNANKQIIISSDRKPSELTVLEERLRSRFEWGFISDMPAPNFETRVAILRKKAENENIEIPDDVITMIANNIESNIRKLEGAFTRVIAFSSLMKLPITKQLAEEALKNVFPDEKVHEITMELIQEVVSSYFKIKVSDLHAKKRTKNLTVPRQIAMYLCRELIADLSLPQIGQGFGGRDHTTVIHACEKVSKERRENAKLDASIEQLISQIERV
ncbi:chromosomal replication initiator protein DnaA [Selenomonas sp. TAMA-11512]|nr:chromosomal replication initiator protein DnaA [Selenomonas sp. TAMA-11512]